MKKKFRMWDTSLKKMIYPEDVAENFFDIMRLKGMCIMQSTCKTDKDDKEIYEGDILEILVDNSYKRKLLCKFGAFNKTIIAIDKKKYTASIVGFYYSSDTYDILLPIITDKVSDVKRMKIIGNIYETPELSVWG